MSDAKPIGQRFSHVYLRKDDLLQDSQRARRRIAAWLGECEDARSKERSDLGNFLVAELGVDVVYQYGYDWKATLEKFSIVDFLDTVSLIYRYLTQQRCQRLGDAGSECKRKIFSNMPAHLQRRISVVQH
ncbi:hypothetical protein QA641_37995 [Bradyrhizobium sp. CB1650]|uniref:hypothetical protein n=1 Tax=Bradyrhizobium sp. CB1650 TaxID=3039153 RepID=UPI0024359927|nr:hypothetical protein [Bradyrhizobium sp. CB1650]WGD51222.1 hypothetical protein QA641_37995 [Bradyrhizobium sp. CB1650]